MLFAKRESDDGRFSMHAATWSGVTGAVRTGFPLSGKSGNSVLTGMSGNCQGILLFVRDFF